MPDIANPTDPGNAAPTGQGPVAGADATSAEELKRQNDEKARQGRIRADEDRRLLAEARTRAEAAEAQAARLAKEVGEIKQWKDDRERLEDEAFLSSLPEIDRLKILQQRSDDKIKALESKRDDSPAPVATQTVSPADIEAGKQRMKPEIIDAINLEFGLTGDFAIDPFDEDLEDGSVATFQASARTMAKILRDAHLRAGDNTAQENVVATKKAETPIVFKTQQEFADAVNKAVSNGFNAGAPLSADPSGNASAGTGPTSDDMKKTLSGYDSRKGPKAGLAELARQRKEAEAAVAGGNRG